MKWVHPIVALCLALAGDRLDAGVFGRYASDGEPGAAAPEPIPAPGDAEPQVELPGTYAPGADWRGGYEGMPSFSHARGCGCDLDPCTAGLWSGYVPPSRCRHHGCGGGGCGWGGANAAGWKYQGCCAPACGPSGGCDPCGAAGGCGWGGAYTGHLGGGWKYRGCGRPCGGCGVPACEAPACGMEAGCGAKAPCADCGAPAYEAPAAAPPADLYDDHYLSPAGRDESIAPPPPPAPESRDRSARMPWLRALGWPVE